MKCKTKFILATIAVLLFFSVNVEAKGGLLGLGINAIVHAPGALATAGGFFLDSTVWMGETVCGAGVTCADLAVSGAGHIKKDPPGALTTALVASTDFLRDTVWGGATGLRDIVFGKK